MIECYAIDWLPSARGQTPVDAVAIDFTIARSTSMTFAQAVDLSMTMRAKSPLIGYIAGTGAGKFTLLGKPAMGEILCMDVTDKLYKWVYRGYSHANGHWLVDELDPSRQYLVIGRDVNKELEPFAWDNVTPASDLDFVQVQKLWADMQAM